jgi:hypothetical protein
LNSSLSKLLLKQRPGHGFIAEFHQMYKELMPILLQFFQKNLRKGNTSKLILKVHITLIPMLEEDTNKGKFQTGPGAVIQICNSSYLGGRDQEDNGQHKKNLTRPSSQQQQQKN